MIFQLLEAVNCSGDIDSCCGDYSIVNIIWFIQRVLDILQVVVPIILIVFASIQLAQMLISPDDEKKSLKKLFNKFIAAIIVFFVPFIVNLVMQQMVVSEVDTYEVVSCWNSAKEVHDLLAITPSSNSVITDVERAQLLSKAEDYEDTGAGVGTSTGDGTILLITGHSYAPYCFGPPTNCRPEPWINGYTETESNREIAVLVQKSLSSKGITADIANQLMAGNDDPRMNKSFYMERYNNTELFNSFDWGKYSYVIEFHFNAGGGEGPLIVHPPGTEVTDIDTQICNAIASVTENSCRGGYETENGAGDYNYFVQRGINITYIEVEFYDNTAAMDNYSAKKDQVADAIAEVVKDNFG